MEIESANEERVDEAERARLGDEVSSFYSQLTTATSSLKTPPMKRPRTVLSRSTAASPSKSPPASSTSAATSPSAPTAASSSALIALPSPNGDFTPSHYFCPTCNDHVPASMPRSQHRTSTVHLFHSIHKPTPTFGIPPNNVGYQMLLHKYDWEQDKGLGAEGQGRLEPIPTRLRAPEDRKGVGHEATLARPLRITHTKSRHGMAEDQEEEDVEEAPLLPNEALALEHKKPEKKSKKKRKRKEKRQQKRDREDRQRQRDQGLHEAVYNEWPVLVAP